MTWPRRSNGFGEQDLDTSEALNLLARRGIGVQTDKQYRHRTVRVGLKVDVTSVGEVLDSL